MWETLSQDKWLCMNGGTQSLACETALKSRVSEAFSGLTCGPLAATLLGAWRMRGCCVSPQASLTLVICKVSCSHHLPPTPSRSCYWEEASRSLRGQCQGGRKPLEECWLSHLTGEVQLPWEGSPSGHRMSQKTSAGEGRQGQDAHVEPSVETPGLLQFPGASLLPTLVIWSLSYIASIKSRHQHIMTFFSLSSFQITSWPMVGLLRSRPAMLSKDHQVEPTHKPWFWFLDFLLQISCFPP